MAIRDWPIKRKLTAILLLISGLVLVLTSAAFVTYQVVTFRQTMRNNLATRSRILAANSTAALAFANEADATEILAALKYDPHMVAAALYTQDGRVLATYPVAASADLIPAALQPDGYRFERGRLVGFTPVAQGGNERLGTLYLASDTKAVSDALRLSTRWLPRFRDGSRHRSSRWRTPPRWPRPVRTIPSGRPSLARTSWGC